MVTALLTDLNELNLAASYLRRSMRRPATFQEHDLEALAAQDRLRDQLQVIDWS